MIDVVSFSKAGGHAINEDALGISQHPSDADCWLCCLADGQGGQAGGGRAAQVACAAGIAAAVRYCPERLMQGSTWTSILRQADQAVSVDPDAGYTTLIGLCICKGIIAGASCGDSAALVACGSSQPKALTLGQAKNPPVGSAAAPFASFQDGLVTPWTVVVMSDGVWKYVGWEGVVQAVLQERGQRLLETLQSRARLTGSGRFQDDFTLVAFEDVG
jgi:serine/threonine protein phosphatase PrpC